MKETLRHGIECRGMPGHIYVVGDAISGMCTCIPKKKYMPNNTKEIGGTEKCLEAAECKGTNEGWVAEFEDTFQDGEKLEKDVEQFITSLLARQKEEFYKTLNSGRKMYEQGRNDEREEVKKLVAGRMPNEYAIRSYKTMEAITWTEKKLVIEALSDLLTALSEKDRDNK